MTSATRPPAGTCARCQQPVAAGAGTVIEVSQGTAASAGVLLHRQLCWAPHVRRSQG